MADKKRETAKSVTGTDAAPTIETNETCYHAPKLEKYGPLTKLTQGGSGPSNETKNVGDMGTPMA